MRMTVLVENTAPKKTINFIKGHMGGNEIVVLDADQIPKGEELETALLVLNSPYIRGHQAGLFPWSKSNAPLKFKIVDAASRGFVSMCGGLTQVFGKALIETDLSKYLDIEPKEPIMEITLETAAGLIPLEIASDNGRVKRILTDMKVFADECYRLGTQPITVANVNAMRVGKFLVVNADAIRKVHSAANFENMDKTTLRLLEELQEAFDKHGYLKRKNADFALYDLNPEKVSNSGRVIFPHRISAGHIETACGTGTVAVGIAMVENGEIDENGDISLLFETGGDIFSLGGSDTTELRLVIRDRKVTQAFISHSLVEIVATGKLWI